MKLLIMSTPAFIGTEGLMDLRVIKKDIIIGHQKEMQPKEFGPKLWDIPLSELLICMHNA